MESSLPEIDFSRFRTGSDGDRREIASQVDQALKTVGFFTLRNHGIPQSRIDDCFAWVGCLPDSGAKYLPDL